MLADDLERARPRVIDELERRAIASRQTPAVGRAARLGALVDELVRALRGEPAENESPAVATTDRTTERVEHELLRNYLIDEVEGHRVAASPTEMSAVAEWSSRATLQRVRDENRHLDALLDSVDESTILLAPEGRILYLNRRAEEVLHETLGLAPEQVLGKMYNEVGVHDELGMPRSPERLLALAREGASFEVVAWGRAKETRLNALFGPDGNVSAVTSVIRDIQTHKLADKRVNLLSKLNMIIGRLDHDKVVEALANVPIPELADWCSVNVIENGKIRRTFIAHRDSTKAAIREALMRAILRWDRHPLWQDLLTSGFQLLSEVNDDLVRRLTDNEEQYRLLTGLGIRSIMVVPLVARGLAAGIMTLMYTGESGRRYGRDDPAMAEELALHAAHALENARLMTELQSSEARFRIALAGARTVVYEQDRSMRYVSYYNPLAPSNLVGKTENDAFPPEEARRLTELKARVLDAGTSVHEEMDLTIGGDERRHYRQAVEPLRDLSGAIIGIIGSATDMTEQQRTQRELTEALCFRERMMGILGHDLRNPLNAIMMTSGLLVRRHDLPPEVTDQARRIRSSADRMGEMIDTLLDFVRARFLGQLPVTPIATDLGEISRGVVDELRAASADPHIELELRGNLKGEWDPSRLSQMLSNLVENAIAYRDPRTAVRASVEGLGTNVTLKVTNQGAPIPANLLPVLFEPFRRGVPQDRSSHGLGLGLYIVQQIVLAHGGTIGVESTEAGVTTFTVCLPRAPKVGDEREDSAGPSREERSRAGTTAPAVP